jgi:glutathione peroxidase
VVFCPVGVRRHVGHLIAHAVGDVAGMRTVVTGWVVRGGGATAGRRLRIMALYDTPIAALDGEPFDLEALRGRAVLVVNVASKCGLTPQYTGLEELQERYAEKGFTVLGVPCNQFGGQEPGTAEEIATFCSATYGVTFPLTEKIDVNGDTRHPLYAELTNNPDAEGAAGDVQWNFEKFLLGTDGTVLRRFRPRTEPTSPEVTEAIEAALP